MANIQGNINQLLTLAGAGFYGLNKLKEPAIQKAKEQFETLKKAKLDFESQPEYEEYTKTEMVKPEWTKENTENLKEPMNLSSENLIGKHKGIKEVKDLTQSFFTEEGPAFDKWQAAKTKAALKSPEALKAKEDATKQMKEILAKNKAMQSMQTKGLNKIKQKDEYEALYKAIYKKLPGLDSETADELVRRYKDTNKGE